METTQLTSVDDVVGVNGIISASLVTRSGEYVESTIPSTTRRDTFSAMSAIILGAAERSAIELNESLQAISVELDKTVLTIFGLDSQHLMAIVSTPEADKNEMIETARAWKEKVFRH